MCTRISVAPLSLRKMRDNLWTTLTSLKNTFKEVKFVFLFHLHVLTFQHMYFFLFSIIFCSSSTSGLQYCDGGQHGYDSLDENMRVKVLFLFLCTLFYDNHVMCCLRDSLCSFFQTLFAAHGPSFKNREVVEPFQNTEIYNLIAGKVTEYNMAIQISIT